MKHFYTFKTMATWLLLLLVSLFALPSELAAQVSFREDFNYPEGNLYGQGGWVRYGVNAEAPIQVVNKPLLTSSLTKYVFYNWLINNILYLCVT